MLSKSGYHNGCFNKETLFSEDKEKELLIFLGAVPKIIIQFVHPKTLRLVKYCSKYKDRSFFCKD